MKRSKQLLCVSFLFAVLPLLPAEPVQADLGYDVFGGHTNKISHIAQADPRFVWVVYEGGTAGRKISRAELPPQLKVKYPYDPQKAADFTRQKAAEYQALLTAEKAGLRVREAGIQQQISTLKKQAAENEHEIGSLNRQIKAAPKSHAASIAKGTKIDLIKAQDDIRQRRENLEASLKQVQGQIDALP